jgi:serine/threonine protein kinase
VDERGTAALCDFGLSVALGDTSSDFSGSSLGAGSIRYMAPEQLDPHCKPTMAIDVYALGCACMEV